MVNSSKCEMCIYFGIEGVAFQAELMAFMHPCSKSSSWWNGKNIGGKKLTQAMSRNAFDVNTSSSGVILRHEGSGGYTLQFIS